MNKNKKHATKPNAVAIVADKVETPLLTVEVPEQVAKASIAETVAAGGTFSEGTLANDVVDYISSHLDAVTGGMRQSILTLDTANRTGENLSNSVVSLLYGRYKKQTVDGLKSAAKHVIPFLREIDCLTYRDPNGLRDVNKIIRAKSHAAHEIVVAGIKRNDSVSAIKKAIAAQVVTPQGEEGDESDDSGKRSPGGETNQVAKSPSGTESAQHLRLAAKDAVEVALSKNSPEKLAEALNLIKGYCFTVSVK